MLHNLIQLILAFLFAPLLSGVVINAKASWQGFPGLPITQVYRDIVNHYRHMVAAPVHGSSVGIYTSLLIFAAVGTAVFYVPLYAGAPLGCSGDIFIVMYLLAMTRVSTTLQKWDGSSDFGSKDHGRDLPVGTLIEPVLAISLLAMAIPKGSAGLTDVLMHLQNNGLAGFSFSHWLTLAAICALMVAEISRMATDNPYAHLEPAGQEHERISRQISGWPLALVTWSHSVKQLLLCSIIANLVLPWHPFWLGIWPAGGFAEIGVGMWLAGMVLFCLKILVFGLILAAFETFGSKKLFLKPNYLLGVAVISGMAGNIISI